MKLAWKACPWNIPVIHWQTYILKDNFLKGINLIVFIAVCDPQCVHGICNRPNKCACEPGFGGDACESGEFQ